MITPARRSPEMARVVAGLAGPCLACAPLAARPGPRLAAGSQPLAPGPEAP